jgi:hypothetical protein
MELQIQKVADDRPYQSSSTAVTPILAHVAREPRTETAVVDAT